MHQDRKKIIAEGERTNIIKEEEIVLSFVMTILFVNYLKLKYKQKINVFSLIIKKSENQLGKLLGTVYEERKVKDSVEKIFNSK